jgi:hypothetical protein
MGDVGTAHVPLGDPTSEGAHRKGKRSEHDRSFLKNGGKQIDADAAEGDHTSAGPSVSTANLTHPT